MIIDDEVRICRLFVQFFEDFDEFAVRFATSAEVALSQLRHEPADVAIVDMRLPGMRGDMFIRTAHSQGLCSRFVLHTGSTEMPLTRELRQIGLTERNVFFKPADMELILERIRELLGGHA